MRPKNTISLSLLSPDNEVNIYEDNNCNTPYQRAQCTSGMQALIVCCGSKDKIAQNPK